LNRPGFSKGYGLANVEKNIPNTPETAFAEAGSICFAAASLKMLSILSIIQSGKKGKDGSDQVIWEISANE